MYEMKKISKLTDEMVTFYLERKADNISVQISLKKEGTYISTSARNVTITERELKRIGENINKQNRLAEMEEYYWTLAGEGGSSIALSLVAIMVDSAEVAYHKDNNIVEINLFRKK